MAGGMGGPRTGPAGRCEGWASSEVARGLGWGTGTASAVPGSAARGSSGTLSAGTAGVGDGMGGPCTGPADFFAGATSRALSSGAGMSSDDCGSAFSSIGGGLSGFAAGIGAVGGVTIFAAGRGLRRFGAFCCGGENSFSRRCGSLSSHVGAANESIGITRRMPKIVMAKASRGIDSLPMAVKRLSSRNGCIAGAATRSRIIARRKRRLPRAPPRASRRASACRAGSGSDGSCAVSPRRRPRRTPPPRSRRGRSR